jgi:hypothetical protein
MAKMIMKFSYETCAKWLREKAASLRSIGLNVTIKENDAPVRTILLRLESSKSMAELVVWETGATSMMFINLAKDDYDLNRHDLILVGDQFESDLGEFFKLVK